MTLVRIQRRRTKGWRMPPNTVYVGRGTPYGNPFKVYDERNADLAVQLFKQFIHQTTTPGFTCRSPEEMVKFKKFLEPLRGKNLACWCALGKPCHADFLLELANGS